MKPQLVLLALCCFLSLQCKKDSLGSTAVKKFKLTIADPKYCRSVAATSAGYIIGTYEYRTDANNVTDYKADALFITPDGVLESATNIIPWDRWCELNGSILLQNGEHILYGNQFEPYVPPGDHWSYGVPFIAKTDESGQLLWTKKIYTLAPLQPNNINRAEVINAMLELPDKRLLVWINLVDMANEVALVCLDEAGNRLWARYFDTPMRNAYMVANEDGSILVAGSGYWGADTVEAYLMKIDRNGNELWTKSFPDAAIDGLAKVADSFYFTLANITANFSQSTSLCRMDANGEWSIVKNYTDIKDSRQLITISDDQMVMVASLSSATYQYALVGVDTDGKEQWRNEIVGDGGYLNDIKTCPDGGYIFATSKGGIYKTDARGVYE